MSWESVEPGEGVPVYDNAPEHIDAAVLLEDVRAFLGRFVAYPSTHAQVAHTLWIAHAWTMPLWESTPRLAFLSPEPGSGKSRALEVTDPLVPRALHAVNASPAALFRSVSDAAGAPTLLYDEIDTVFGPRAKDNEDIRGMLNAGHRRGATAMRAVVRGKSIEVEHLPAYCAVALAGLDDLPDTIASRSITVRMRRRAPGERVEPWRHRLNASQAEPLARRLEAWAAVLIVSGVAWPEMPEGVEDRDADVWEALLAIADVAGGHWPETARRSAVALVADSKAKPSTLGVQLLSDIRGAFKSADRLGTEDVLDVLTSLDESPWGDIRGKALDARGLSRRLAKYDIKPKNVRVADRVVKGYEATDFHDAWTRYLPEVAVPLIQESMSDLGVVGALDNAISHPRPALAQKSATSATGLLEALEADPGDCTHGVPVSARCSRCGGIAIPKPDAARV